MEQRILNRVAASFEAEIRSLRAENTRLRGHCDAAYSAFNVAINSGLCEANPSVSAYLEAGRDAVKEGLTQRGRG
jgi:hypothetical protein